MLIASDLAAARVVEESLLSDLSSHGYSEPAVFAIRLALEEALNNAVRHGNRFDPDKTVQITFHVDQRQATITVTDQGEGFNPVVIPDPTVDENLEKPSGRGIWLMKAYMDEVRYSPCGTEVHMVKLNAPGEACG